MTTIAELASLVRSKNAGPFELTFDIMFDSAESYARVKRSGAVTGAVVARLFNLSENEVKLFFADVALAIKATIPRPIFQGDLGDADGHGGQQYAPLMSIEVPD
jgi:hypothetical protein